MHSHRGGLKPGPDDIRARRHSLAMRFRSTQQDTRHIITALIIIAVIITLMTRYAAEIIIIVISIIITTTMMIIIFTENREETKLDGLNA